MLYLLFDKIVNNVSYIRYQETARMLHFSKMKEQLEKMFLNSNLGCDYVNAIRIGPILSETNIKYKYPLKYPDTILVSSEIKNENIINNNKFIQTHHIYSIQLNRIVAEGTGIIMAYDYENNCKAKEFPFEIIQSFMELNKQNSLYMLPLFEKEFNL